MMDEPYKSRILKPQKIEEKKTAPAPPPPPPPLPDFPDSSPVPARPDNESAAAKTNHSKKSTTGESPKSKENKATTPPSPATTVDDFDDFDFDFDLDEAPKEMGPRAIPNPLSEKKLALEKKKAELERALRELRSLKAKPINEGDLKAAEVALAEQKANLTDIQKQARLYQKALQARGGMRSFVMEEPGIVDFILSDLDWLRVMILLYGALNGLHLSDCIIEYDEIAYALQLDGAEQAGALAELRGRPYWRESWEGGDVAYNTSVHLNDDCKPRREKARAADLAFDPSQICFETPIDAILREHLQRRSPGRSLAAPFLEIIRESVDQPLRASAFLALLALDPLLAESEWRRPGGNCDALAPDLRRLIEQRQDLFRDAVILYTAGEWLRKELPQWPAKLSAEKQEYILSVFMRSVCEVMPFPHVTGLVEAMQLPYANAELWAGWLAGIAGDDAVYHLAVVFDTIGKKIHSADAVANLHRTHAKRYFQNSVSLLNPIPPVWEDGADHYGEALTFAHRGRDSLKGLFHEGIIVHHGVSSTDPEALRIDALAATVLLPRESYERVLPMLDKSMADKSPYEIATQLRARVNAISDPAVKARVLWRLSLAGWTSFEQAEEAAQQIVVPLQKVAAYERLIQELPHDFTRLLPLHLQATRAIKDDENNRVRALCRHALLLPSANRIAIVQEAIHDFWNIPEAHQRAETLVLMQQAFADQPDILAALAPLLTEQTDAWYRLKCQGLPSFVLANIHPELAYPVQATSVVLHAVLKDMLSLLQGQQVADDAWQMLARVPTRAQAMSMLLTKIASAEKGILPFTAGAAHALEALASQGQVSEALRLLPHLGQTRLETIEPWMNAPPHPDFLPYAHLMAAESDRLRGRYVPGVLNLLGRGTGIAFYRAALLLHGHNVYIGQPNPEHLASLIELEGLLQIGEFIHTAQERQQHGASNSASWMSMNLVYDSEQILEGLVNCLLQNSNRRSAASILLSRVRVLTEAVVKKFVELLVTHREGAAAIPLFQGFCALQPDKLKTPWPDDGGLEDYWSKLPIEVVESARGLPSRLPSVSSVIQKCASGSTALNLEALDRTLQAQSVTAPKYSASIIENCAIYELKSDPATARECAAELAKSSTTLRCLFVWLKSSLTESINDPQRFFPQRSALLEIAAASGVVSPATVFNLVEELQLEPLLVRATIDHLRFDGRAGAVTLLGYVRNPGDEFLRALRSALRDVAEVQQAALKMVQRLRYVSPALTDDLIDLLQADDTTLSYAASRLLSILGRHEQTTAKERERIIRSLSRAIQMPSSLQSVSAFEHSEGHVWVTRLGSLAQRHYQSLLEIVNLV